MFLYTLQIRTRLDPLKWPVSSYYVVRSDDSASSSNEVTFPTSENAFYPSAKVLTTVPAPPIPRVYETFPFDTVGQRSKSESTSSSMSEALNPDVPEFVPMELMARANDSDATDADTRAKNEDPFLRENTAESTISVAIASDNDPPSPPPPPTMNNGSSTVRSSFSSPNVQRFDERTNSSNADADDAWQEVKRRVKQPHKERSEEKEKNSDTARNAAREELDFQFDEDYDTPPPTGRHNAFSEWSVV